MDVRDVFLNEKANLKQKKEAFEIANSNRELELKLYWQRSAYFVVFTGVALMASYSKEYDLDCLHRLILIFFASFSSFCWWLTTRGAKYWQENWEKIAEEAEICLGHYVYQCFPVENSAFYNPFGKKCYSVSKANSLISFVIFILCFSEGVLHSYCQNNWWVCIVSCICIVACFYCLLGDVGLDKVKIFKREFLKIYEENGNIAGFEMNDKLQIKKYDKIFWFEISLNKMLLVSSLKLVMKRSFYDKNIVDIRRCLNARIRCEYYADFSISGDVSVVIDNEFIRQGSNNVFKKFEEKIENVNKEILNIVNKNLNKDAVE